MRSSIAPKWGDALASRRNNFKRNSISLILLLSTLVLTTWSCSGHRVPDVEANVSPCVLGSSPTRFDGQRVRVTGFVTSTKEGAYIWEDGCQNSGVILRMTGPIMDDTAFQNLLLRYGLSDSPIRATLRGSFRYNRFT